MKKTYKAISDVSFNIALRGGNKRISFQPVTSGGSVYVSRDEEEIKAIEAKDSFGLLFRCIDEEKETEQHNGEKSAVSSEDKIQGEELKEIEEIDNLADAREFLRENGGENKDLRSKIAIVEIARSLGFSFPNI